MSRILRTAGLTALLAWSGQAVAQAPQPAEPAAADAAPDGQPPAQADAVTPPAADAASATPAAPAPVPGQVQPEPASQEGAAPNDDDEGDTGFVALGAGDSEFQQAQEGPKLDIYGFADFSYSQLVHGDESGWSRAYQTHGSFFVGHLNLYLSAQLAERWRSLMEVRFSYLPNGAEYIDTATGATLRTSTAVPDYAELEKINRWGSIIIERAWLEYQPLDFLTIRGGQWLTPYGFWNEDHGSPTIVAVHRPYAISDALFPERQTGLEVYGKIPIDESALGYHVTVSNGRGPVDTYRDLDGNKAIGGRLFLETHALGDLDVGVAGYKGSYTDAYRTLTADVSSGTPELKAQIVKTQAYDELSLAGEARWRLGDFLLQSEVIMNEARYEEGTRPVLVGVDGRHYEASDYRRWGMYALAGYRTPWLGLMPFAMYEYHSFADGDALPPAHAFTGGVNIRPIENVALKVEYLRLEFDGVGSSGLGRKPLEIFATQAAWAF